MTEFPAGPWVVVVGMHRSGTSAITGVLVALGLHVSRPEDLMPGVEANNPDFWESMAAYQINEDLLERLGGSWDAPPDLVAGWEQDPAIRAAHDTPGLMAEAYTEAGPSVWKDPRVCILLPYWKLYLPRSFAAVLVCRPPHPVARSLEARDGIPELDGVALWERYNRAAIEGLDGIETLVVDYDSAVEDPLRLIETLTRWLDSLDGFEPGSSGWNIDEAQSVISAGLRHEHGEYGMDDLLPEQRALVDYLTELEGEHHPLRGALPGPESPWATALIAQRRRAILFERMRERLVQSDAEREHLAKRLEEEQQAVQAHRDAMRSLEQVLDAYREQLSELSGRLNTASRQLNGIYESTAWRMTRPLRSGVPSLRRFSRPRSGPEGDGGPSGAPEGR